MDREAIGQGIRSLRKTRKLTLREVAEKTGETSEERLSYQYVSHVERGEANATYDALDRILEALNGESVCMVLGREQLDATRLEALRRFAAVLPHVSPDTVDGVLLGLEARASVAATSEDDEL